MLYFAFCRSVPFKSLIHSAIAASVVSTLAYLGYRSEMSALLLSAVFGAVGMTISLTILDLAARGCPKQAEGTFFALLMAVWNGGVQLSQITGGWLYDRIGLPQLIVVSATFTALCWLLVPLLKLEIFAVTAEGSRCCRLPSGLTRSQSWCHAHSAGDLDDKSEEVHNEPVGSVEILFVNGPSAVGNQGVKSMSIGQFLFSARGRVDRKQWWLKFTLPLFVLLLLAAIADEVFFGDFQRSYTEAVTNGTTDTVKTTKIAFDFFLTNIVAIAAIIPAIFVDIKRWHDRDKSGWWMLIALVPVIGSLWLLIELRLPQGHRRAQQVRSAGPRGTH